MSTLLANRAQSAYPRSVRRSDTNSQTYHIKQRPITSMGIHQSHTNLFNQAVLTKHERSILSATINSRRRQKTASIGITTNTQSPSAQLHSNEIENLLRSLDRDDKVIVRLDCLANYRTLVQTIDLRQTPLDCQLLCALQRRENGIVQRNACHDRRFRSLIDILAPSHAVEEEKNDSNDVNHRNHVLEYQSNNSSY